MEKQVFIHGDNMSVNVINVRCIWRVEVRLCICVGRKTKVVVTFRDLQVSQTDTQAMPTLTPNVRSK